MAPTSYTWKEQVFARKSLFAFQDLTPHLPMAIGDYTDFYAGENHAYNASQCSNFQLSLNGSLIRLVSCFAVQKMLFSLIINIFQWVTMAAPPHLLSPERPSNAPVAKYSHLGTWHLSYFHPKAWYWVGTVSFHLQWKSDGLRNSNLRSQGMHIWSSAHEWLVCARYSSLGVCSSRPLLG